MDFQVRTNLLRNTHRVCNMLEIVLESTLNVLDWVLKHYVNQMLEKVLNA